MANSENNIERYWCRTYNGVLNNTGFLLNPQNKYSFTEQNIVDLNDISQNACILLCNTIGEVSYDFSIMHQRVRDKYNDTFCIYHDLSSYCSESRLVNDIFNSCHINTWKESDKDLYLFISGIDLCSVNIHTVFQIFISEINALHEYKDRLYIRVLSISGLWDINLERFLDTFWGVENNIRLSVAPLRQEDVSTICKNRNIDSDEFLKIVIEKGLQPLAIIPYSLSQLLETELSQIYRDELSSDELYYNSCMILSESSVSKIKNRDFISSNKMIAIAARIAAIMAFCRKDFVTIYKLDSNRVDTLLVSEIFEEEETTGEYNFTILHRDIIETIIFSGLFYKNSDGRFSFYHQAFQDYLAAKFIINHEYDNEKVISLLTNSKDREGKLFEWIRGVNTWLQNITPRIDILKFFISHDPLKVLNGRIINDDQIKEELVKSILEKFNNAEIIDNEWGLLSNNGHKLLHSKMAEQILPYISGKENHILARRNAMEMAEACNLVELQEPLWKIVSDNTEDIHVREQAMSSLSKLVDDDQILSKLVKVATTDDKSDENDGLKGYALNITWNKRIISVEEIFNSLTKPKKDSFVGIYKAFIEFLLPRELDIKDFVVALEWMRKNIDELYDSLSVFSRLVSRILQLGWENYNSLDNKDQFVDTVRLILIQHHPIFPVRDSFFDTDENVYEVPKEVRFEVIDKLLAHCKNDEFYNFDFFSSRLILHDEFENAVQYCKGSNNIELWKRILCYFSYENQERVSFLRTSFPEDVDGVFSFIFTPRTIDINRKIKEKAQQEKRAKDEKDALELIEKKILECISKYSETKDPLWWASLFRHLGMKYSNRYYEEILSSDITHLDNWALLPQEKQPEVVELSKYYIENHNEESDTWFGKNIYSYIASAGFKSLIITEIFDSSYIENIDKNILEKWRYVIINYGENSETQEHRNRKEKLIKCLFEKSPQKANEVIREKILIENNTGQSYLFALRSLEQCFDINSETMLLDLLEQKNINNKSREQIINLLLEKAPVRTFEYIKEVFRNPIDDELKKYIIISLLRHNNDYDDGMKFWSFAFQYIGDDESIEKEYYLSLAPGCILYSFNNPVLNEEHLSFLFERLYKLFPPDEDPKHEGVHYIGQREEVASLRDRLLGTLSSKGTPESIQELTRLKTALPDAGIEFSIVTAKNNFRNTCFDRISPANFQRLSRNGQFRIISNGDDLLKLIEESLVRLEYLLQGAQPLSSSLWNIITKTKKSQYSTKKEEFLSDYIASHLRYDLEKYAITPYREVQLRCKRINIDDGRTGENIDILVDCNLRGKRSSVIIEIKGSWNSEIPTNMQNQLYERYMKTSKCNHGLYLIGWYDSSRDVRNRTGCKSIEETRDKYKQKAKELSETNNVSIRSFVLDCRLKN